ncbi:MAG: four helix bundle protein [Kiritimatiellae bacterium]|nr:four helix bundle protein [Kiritimatiellia bacterium]
MRDHKKLRAFELADKIALAIYRITRGFPQDEVYGLSAQMRRAAVSVPSNIVEGCARSTKQEYCRFLDIAFGSLRELIYQFSLATRLNYIPSTSTAETDTLLSETEKVLSSLIRSLRRAPSQPQPLTTSTP